jgi:hypothetical protein
MYACMHVGADACMRARMDGCDGNRHDPSDHHHHHDLLCFREPTKTQKQKHEDFFWKFLLTKPRFTCSLPQNAHVHCPGSTCALFLCLWTLKKQTLRERFKSSLARNERISALFLVWTRNLMRRFCAAKWLFYPRCL